MLNIENPLHYDETILHSLEIKIILVILLFPFTLIAQETIVTDRPDITESAVTVPVYSFQVESGFALNNSGEEAGDITINIRDLSIFTTLLRYGISDRIELRLGSEYMYQRINSEETIKSEGLNGVLAGMKIQLLRDDVSNPDIALLLHLILPVGNENFSSDKIEPEAIVAIAHGINDMFSLSYNLGGFWNSSAEELHYIYRVSLGISLFERAGAFIEFFGEAANNVSFGKNADLGFTYLIADNFQADISAGINLDGPENNWFLSTGVGFRLPE